MSGRQSDNERWENCSAGELGGLVANLRRRRQIRNTKRATGIAAAAVCVILIGSLAITSFSDPKPTIAAIKCDRVEELVPEYIDGHLNADQTAQIDKHVHGCKRCRELIARMRQGEAEDQAAIRAMPGDLQPRATLVIATR